MAVLGVSLVGLVVGLALLSAGFWVIERFWPALQARPRPPGSRQADLLFGTFCLPKGKQPERFGIAGVRPKESFFAQLAWGFRRRARA